MEADTARFADIQGQQIWRSSGVTSGDWQRPNFASRDYWHSGRTTLLSAERIVSVNEVVRFPRRSGVEWSGVQATGCLLGFVTVTTERAMAVRKRWGNEPLNAVHKFSQVRNDIAHPLEGLIRLALMQAARRSLVRGTHSSVS
jgi:hypothetical protein